MKKLLCGILLICTLLSLTACGGKPQEETAAGFKPSLWRLNSTNSMRYIRMCS